MENLDLSPILAVIVTMLGYLAPPIQSISCRSLQAWALGSGRLSHEQLLVKIANYYNSSLVNTPIALQPTQNAINGFLWNPTHWDCIVLLVQFCCFSP
jgi:hypothetical protein